MLTLWLLVGGLTLQCQGSVESTGPSEAEWNSGHILTLPNR